jgi:hypothetical protein
MRQNISEPGGCFEKGILADGLSMAPGLSRMAVIQPWRVYQETGFETGAVTSSLVHDRVFPGNKIPGV